MGKIKINSGKGKSNADPFEMKNGGGKTKCGRLRISTWPVTKENAVYEIYVETSKYEIITVSTKIQIL